MARNVNNHPCGIGFLAIFADIKNKPSVLVNKHKQPSASGRRCEESSFRLFRQSLFSWWPSFESILLSCPIYSIDKYPWNEGLGNVSPRLPRYLHPSRSIIPMKATTSKGSVVVILYPSFRVTYLPIRVCTRTKRRRKRRPERPESDSCASSPRTKRAITCRAYNSRDENS